MIAFILVWQVTMPVRGQNIISLEGGWKFRLDPDREGIWLKFPVDREMAANGELVFDARTLTLSTGGILAGNLFEWCNDGPVIEQNDDIAVRHTAFLKGRAWISTEILDLRPAARGNSGHVNNPAAFYSFR